MLIGELEPSSEMVPLIEADDAFVLHPPDDDRGCDIELVREVWDVPDRQ